MELAVFLMVCVQLSYVFIVNGSTTDVVSRQKLLLILSDGFRWDYFRPNMTGFQRMFSEGVKAEYMIPDFPSVSYTNYYSIATGLHPESHGMVGNYMYDPIYNERFDIGTNPEQYHAHWWADGDPIWITAKRQNRTSHMFWWPGCEVEIHGLRPDYCLPYNGYVPDDNLSWAINTSVELFRNDASDFVALYHFNVDSDGHRFGPFSRKLESTLNKFDSEILRLQKLLDNTAVRVGDRVTPLSDIVNVMVVSDHGMTLVSDRVKPIHHVNVFEYVDWRKLYVYLLNDFVGQLWPYEEHIQEVYESLVASGVRGMRVYLKKDIPERFHYKNHYRVAPIVLILDPYYTFAWYSDRIGQHGCDNNVSDMWAIFVAKGPAFKKNYTQPAISCIELYQVMCSILDITPSPHNGTWHHVIDMLAAQSQSSAFLFALAYSSGMLRAVFVVCLFMALSTSVVVLTKCYRHKRFTGSKTERARYILAGYELPAVTSRRAERI